MWILPVAAVAMIGLAFVSAPERNEYEGEVTFAQVQEIIDTHCVRCHSQTPTHEIWREAPQGVMFDTPDQIGQRAARINAQVVISRAMPLGNETGMTDEQRAILGAWYQQGAPTR